MATRYNKTFPLDDQPTVDGDAGFVGVNARLPLESLQPGWVRAADNFEFRPGGMMTRRGLHCPVWARLDADGDPLGAFLGSGAVRHPVTGELGFVLATATAIYFAQPGVPALALTLPAPLASRVRFIQAYDRVLAFRAGETPWEWSGGAAWTEVDRTDHADGTRPIPLAAAGEVLNQRVLVAVPNTPGDVDISDIGDYTRYAILARVRCDTGRGDAVVRVFAFTKDAALVFKGRSIFLVSGLSSGIGTLILTVSVVNPELGLLAPESVASTGADVLFLSGTGVYRVRQVVQERIETAAVAVSQDIDPILKTRVNWRAASSAHGAVWGECYYLALPVDGSAANNAIAVYNLTSNAWEGIHTYPGQIDELKVTDLGGEQRLFGIDHAAGRVYLLYEDREDCLPEGPEDIVAEVTMRGYLAGHAGRKRWNTVEIATSEWHASWGATLIVDGVSEQQTLYPSTLTRSRTRNIQAGVRAWNPTNERNDHGTAGREDYAVILDPPLVLGTGIILDREQSSPERFAAGEIGRAGQVQVRALRGRLTLRGVQAEGTTFDRAYLPTS